MPRRPQRAQQRSWWGWRSSCWPGACDTANAVPGRWPLCSPLFATGPAFTGQPDPRSWRRSGVTLLGSTALAVLVGLTVLFLDSDGKPRMASLPAATREAAAGLAALSGAGGPVASAAPQTATLAL